MEITTSRRKAIPLQAFLDYNVFQHVAITPPSINKIAGDVKRRKSLKIIIIN